MKKYSRVCANIDLSAIEYNFEQMHSRLNEGTKMIAVIKADGYGHGALPIAKMMEEKSYLWGYAVATPEEAFLLRKGGIEKPIILLGFAFPEHYEEMIEKDIRICVFKKETAVLVHEIAKKRNIKARIHLAVDTGMSRIGFKIDNDSINIIKEISEYKYLELEGIFTHFARADEENVNLIKEPLRKFVDFTSRLKEEGVEIELHHCSNSAALIRYPEANMDIVRAGISIYGLYPSDEMEQNTISLKPAMNLISHISYIKDVEAGDAISYGGTFTAKEKMKVATIPVGYADGYPRLLSNKGYVMIRGKKAAILGRICMDQFMVDVTNIPDVQEYDAVLLAGKLGNDEISIEMLGKESGRFHYEFICDITKRVPRAYYYKGKLVYQKDYFEV